MELRTGKTARTPGHQGCFVIGSSEDMKAMKNVAFGSLGNSSRFAEAGTTRFFEIGIFEDLRFYGILEELTRASTSKFEKGFVVLFSHASYLYSTEIFMMP